MRAITKDRILFSVVIIKGTSLIITTQGDFNSDLILMNRSELIEQNVSLLDL